MIVQTCATYTTTPHSLLLSTVGADASPGVQVSLLDPSHTPFSSSHLMLPQPWLRSKLSVLEVTSPK